MNKTMILRYYCASCNLWWRNPIYARRSHQCPMCHQAMHMQTYHGRDEDLADAPLTTRNDVHVHDLEPGRWQG
jgi:hypothetical protein